MRAVLDIRRTGFIWWGILAALVFLIPGAWLSAAANFLRTTPWLQANQAPMTWLTGLRDTIDAIAQAVPNVVSFNPNGQLAGIGPISIPNVVIGVLIGGMLIIVAFLFYWNASATPGILDDLLAMVFIYLVLRVEGVTMGAIPFFDALNKSAPTSYLLILLGFMILTMLGGRAGRDSTVFFKVLLEALLLSLLIAPRQTLDAFAGLIELPTKLHEFLALTGYFPMIMAVWAVLGVVLAVVNLYTVSKPAPAPVRAPSSGGGGGAPKKA